METIYDAVNADTDKIEARKRAKNKQLGQEEGKRLWGSLPSSASQHRKQCAGLGFTWIPRAESVSRQMGMNTEGGIAI